MKLLLPLNHFVQKYKKCIMSRNRNYHWVYDKLHIIQVFLFSCFAPNPKGVRKREKFENPLVGDLGVKSAICRTPLQSGINTFNIFTKPIKQLIENFWF